MLRLIFGDLSPLAFSVLARHMDVYRKRFKVLFYPAFLDPLFFFVGMGFGVGALIKTVGGVSYAAFIAPAVAAIATMMTPSLETVIGSTVRLRFQRTFDAILATPASIEDVITGDILYGAVKGLVHTAAMLIVIAAFGYARQWQILWTLPLAVLASVMFASMGMVFAAYIPDIDWVDYFFSLGLTPMFLFSGTYFPLHELPQLVQRVAWFLPLTHVVRPFRALFSGQWSTTCTYDVLWCAVVTLILYAWSLRSMRRKIVH